MNRIHVRQHEVQPAVDFARVQHRDDEWVLKPGRGLDLAKKPRGDRRLGKLRSENLYGDMAAPMQVAREIDDRRAAASELTLDDVAFGKSDGS